MEALLSSVPVLLFAVFLWVVSSAIRTVAEKIRPNLSKSAPLNTARNVWEKVVLPNVAVILGAVTVFLLPTEDYPSFTMSNGFSKLTFGVFMGSFCSYFYAAAKGMLQAFVGRLKVQGEEVAVKVVEEVKLSGTKVIVPPPPAVPSEDVPAVETPKAPSSALEPPVNPPPAA